MYHCVIVAIGLGATSCLNGIRYARPRKFSDYIDWVQDQVSQKNKFSKDEEITDTITMYNNGVYDQDEALAEIVMTRLRTSDGLNLSWIEKKFGKSKVDAILRGMELGLDLNLASLDLDTNCLTLSSPDGFLFSNTILSNVFVELT